MESLKWRRAIHKHSLGHVKLQKVTKEQIASKIAAGVAVQRILDDIRDSIQNKFY